MQKISVVIPSKDRKKSLERILPTYFNQLEVGEVIVVVDGSTDGSYEFLISLKEVYSNLVVIKNERNLGTPTSKNKAISVARHSLIFIGEDDLELEPDFFKVLTRHMVDLGADLMSGRCVWKHDYETRQTALARADSQKGTYIDLKNIEVNSNIKLENDEFCIMNTAPVLVKSHVFNTVSFDSRFEVNFWREETDFQFSAQENGYKLGVCPHAVCYNVTTQNDKTGSHATAGLKRAQWIIINNWRFVNKHQAFILKNFQIKNIKSYIAFYALKRVFIELLFPPLVRIKVYLHRKAILKQ